MHDQDVRAIRTAHVIVNAAQSKEERIRDTVEAAMQHALEEEIIAEER